MALPSVITSDIEHAFRESSGRVLATLIGGLRDFHLAEDVLQEALVVALEKWPTQGIPRNPGAWLLTVARRKAIDRLRRSKKWEADEVRALELLEQKQSSSKQRDDMSDEIPDDRLKLIFTCCHPALNLDAQVALTLNTLGGLTTAEIAKAFLVPKATMAQRLVRAKRKIKQAGIPYRVPPTEQIGERLDGILTVIYLIFNEGYAATSGENLIRDDLCTEAIRLGTVLTQLLKAEPGLRPDAEALGLLALMLLHDARRSARVSSGGELVLLDDQDRTLWDREQINIGVAVLDQALEMRNSGPYQIQAAISALHATADTPAETDWAQIALLYGGLVARDERNPILKLNQAVAISMADGPLAGLAKLQALEVELQDYYLFHATKADLYRRAGSLAEAADSYRAARELTENRAEQLFLEKRLAEVTAV